MEHQTYPADTTAGGIVLEAAIPTGDRADGDIVWIGALEYITEQRNWTWAGDR